MNIYIHICLDMFYMIVDDFVDMFSVGCLAPRGAKATHAVGTALHAAGKSQVHSGCMTVELLTNMVD